MPPIDPAIIQALSLEQANTTITSHGGSSFTNTFKLTTKDANGKQKCYFMKTGKGEDSKVMFAGIFSFLILDSSFTLPEIREISHERIHTDYYIDIEQLTWLN